MTIFVICFQDKTVATSNTSDQLSTYDTDTIAEANSNYFSLPLGHISTDIKHNQVVFKEENRGYDISKQFTLNKTAATIALRP